MNIYTIIVHYNTPEEVVLLTEDLINAGVPNHHIIIVDNLSEETALHLLQNRLAKWEQVNVLPQQKNGGFGYGVNRAVEFISTSEQDAYMHVVNSDARVNNLNYLIELSTYLDNHPSVVMVGPRVLEKDGTTVQNTILPITTVSNVFSFRKKYSCINHSANANNPIAVDCLNGVCFMVRMSAFKRAGGFDEQYFMYNEEQDLCFNLKKSGGQIYFLPVDSIVHDGGSLLEQEQPDWRFLYKRRNIVLFLRKHQSRMASIFMAFVFAVSSIPKFLRHPSSITWFSFIKAVWSVA